MNENVINLVNAIKQGDAIATEQAFEAAMADKLSTRIDDLRQSIASNMFNQSVVEEDSTIEEQNNEEYISMEEYEALSEEEKAEYELVDEGLTGAVAGGIAGGVAAGPIGALAGAYLGHKIQQGANAAKKLAKKKSG